MTGPRHMREQRAELVPYAKIGGPPDVWERCQIYQDIDRYWRKLPHVIECSAKEGWAVCYKMDADGRVVVQGDESAETERVEGIFEIRVLPQEAFGR